ncbi:MAG: right-handed parallel beta-helix repeat-containing protein [Novosphingobium sp.]
MINRLRQIPFARVVIATLCASIAIPASSLNAEAARTPYSVTETGKSYRSLQGAVNAIGNGQGTIVIAPGRYVDCAVQEGGSVRYLAGEPGQVIFERHACEDKAALVLRGYNAEVSGIVFQNIESSDGNGAGIRLEKGNLTVTQSWFKDSQQGILSGNDLTGRIIIDKSTFTRLGTCAYSGGCAHSIYIGNYGLLRVTRSRFEIGRGGHYVKARAPRVEIASSSFDDSQGKWSNYMIDLPEGATGQITNNVFVQGPHHENHTAFIAVAAEERKFSSSGLKIAGNDARLAPGVDWETAFIADWSGQALAIGQNRIGAGITPFVHK